MLKFISKNLHKTDKLDVVLHIGAPKTGSSAIQRFCAGNREALLLAGFYYPQHSLDINGISGGHAILPSLLKNNADDAAALFRDFLEEARQRNATLLLSAEALYGQSASMAPLLDGLKVRVVGWFRDPVGFMVSNHNQAIKRHFSRQKLSDFCLAFIGQKPWAYFNGAYLHAWADVVGDTHCKFLPYQVPQEGENSSIELKFLDMLEVPRRQFRKFHIDAQKVNRSYVESALELKRLLNYVLTENMGDLCSRIDWALQSYSDISKMPARGLVRNVPEGVIRMLCDQFSDTNRALRERFPQFGADFGELNLEAKSPHSQELLGLDLYTPFRWLLREYPDVGPLLYDLVKKEVAKGDLHYSLLKLADLLGVPYAEPSVSIVLMPPQRLNVLLNQNAQIVDCIRETALMMEAAGDLTSASVLIERAMTLRPDAQQLQLIAQRIRQKNTARGLDSDSG